MWFAVFLTAFLADDPPTGGKELPLTTKPFFPVKGLSPRSLVQVSEYSIKSSPLVTRVYRYVLKGDYRGEVAKLTGVLSKRDGWRSAAVSTTETDFWRDPRNSPVVKVGLVVQQGRLVKDKKTAGGWKALPAEQSKGWLWISYNEEFKVAGH